jgi:cyclopropane-fatty-acyl-phospholipid synthase
MACAKLDIGAEDRVADVGCGWGGFVAHSAGERGAQTIGVTISEKQADWANARIKALGLEGKARVDYQHYKDMPRGDRFDKIAAFQCTEHMDEERLHEFFQHMWDMLPPGGLLLVEFMTARVRLNAHPFMDQYVFPDGQQFPLDVPLSHAEGVGFELLDVEGMRGDYTRTIREWNRRLTENRARCVALVGEAKYRIWRLYLQYAAYGYSVNRFNCYQCVWRKNTRNAAASRAEQGQRITRG